MHRFPDIVSIGMPIVNIGRLIGMNARGRTPFGQRMLAARREARLTQVQVCKALDIAQSTLSELESIANSSGKVVEFAALYGRDPLWLATGEGASEASGKSHLDAAQEREADVQQIATIYANLSPTERRRFLHLLAAARDDAPVLGDDWGELWTSRNTEQLIDETRARTASKKQRRLG